MRGLGTGEPRTDPNSESKDQRVASPSHKRERARRRPAAALIAAPIAILATGGAVALGVVTSAPPTDLLAVDESAAGNVPDRSPVISRGDGSRGGTSRDADRVRPSAQAVAREPKAVAPRLSPVDRALLPEVVATAVSDASSKQWTTTELNIWTRPDKKAEQLGVLDSGKKVPVTGREMLGRQEIVLDGKSRWVTSGYLSDEKPDPGPSLGGTCTNGSSVPPGVSPNIQAIHQAVCANFPEIATYGTLRSDGEHAQGIAMDIMVAGDRGWQVAEFLREYFSELGVSYVIHAQRIWSVQRSSEGWRAMEDRGSVTANHYDHVHVTTY